ncbi:MAG: PDZ domain-containing protein [Clostridia bacterium]|nr:PDZ domain-containing protein [Clostridia bacterium]
MNKKVSLGICVSLIIIAITATFALTMVISSRVYDGIISGLSLRSINYKSVEEIENVVSNYFYGNIENQNSLSASLAEGYIKGLNDGNSRYLDSEEYAAYTAKLEGGITGIGVETAFDYRTGDFVITHVYENSPAEKAGLKELDVITAIADVPVHRGNYADLQENLYGSRLSAVKVEYERDGETKVVEPMLGFRIPSVSSRAESNVGYIKIKGFYKDTASEFKEAAEKLSEQGAESIIIDVRGTSEGSIDYAAQVIDVIVPTIQGNIAVLKDENGNIYKDKIYTAENSSIMMPFIVLINEETSGPAELFACDLRDISQAQLVGTRTAGVGTTQELFALEDGGAVLLTVALVEPKNGADAVYHEKGIEPTVEVNLATGNEIDIDLLTDEQDNQLRTAFNMLAA